ncbi:hypothetical protein Pth03_70190 [Planotetraspora thailandica]|uniref:Glycoside hydrolase 35 catalytic domain-containing protein n=1 Tax=Planotetraspora thailandica TaxID=487172 RepID=A0A8J3Y0Q9_9ACTN|nr:beta-galactosidase [Planotetraspora thailandica]GII58630.1 hypothetical protein Pth03_70190 [Planotetraspora thailandica]
MSIEISNGVVRVDGSPRVLVTADYPYYRDEPSAWADRLRAMRDDMGVEVITCYLPWRHHQPVADEAPDFTGRTHPARDVVGFFRLCDELGMKVIAKPGPFIHAETTYGGLPDWVDPSRDPAVEPLLDAAGEPSLWSDGAGRPGRPLPAPLAPEFLSRVTQWLAAVGKEVLDAVTYPDGPVIMMQIANEGIFTSGALPVSAYDYSASGLAFFRSCLARWYGTPEEYNRLHATAVTSWDEIEPPRSWTSPTSAHEQQAHADWGRFHAEYLAEVYRLWNEAVACRVPTVVNLNPPTIADLDDWLTRVRPRTWGDIAYGFTNWMGVVSADPDAHARYVIAAKLFPGPNMEENWGFSELYDRAYADATTSYHQTLLALAAGATGFNVYTGAATSGWDRDLDSAHEYPYPDSSPIGANGEVTPKAETVRWLADFFAAHGEEFLESRPVTGGAFGLYLPYAGIGAWARGAEDAPGCGRALLAFHARMRAAGLDYALVDLETVTPEELSAHPSVTVPGGSFMHAGVQQLLADYAANGGRVVLDGPAPTLDEHLRPCTVLADAGAHAGGEDTDSVVKVVRGEADAYLRVHPDRDVSYLTVLVSAGNEGSMAIQTPYGLVEVVTARGGAAVVRIAGGRIDDFVVKGVNAFLDSAVRAGVSLDGTAAVTPEGKAADLARIGGTVRRLG